MLTNIGNITFTIYSPYHTSTYTNFNVQSLFTTMTNGVTSGQVTLTTPTSTATSFSVYSPNIVSGVVTGAVSYNSWTNGTVSAIVNTGTNGGTIIITLNLNLPIISTIATSTSTNPTGNSNQTKAYFAKSHYSVWFSDGTHIIDATSPDGAVWTQYTVASATTGTRFSLYYNQVGNYVDYVYNTTGLKYGRITPQTDGSITWVNTEQTVKTSSCQAVSIATDNNGFPAIAFVSSGHPYIVIDGRNDGTWTNSSTYELSTTSSNFWKVQALSLVSGNLYVLYGYNSTLYGVLLTKYLLGSPETVTTDIQGGFSATTFGDEIYVTYIMNTLPQVSMISRTASGWSGVTSLSTITTTNSPVISVNYPQDKVYVFWPQSDLIYYRTYDLINGSLGSITTWIGELTYGILSNSLTCYQRDYGGHLSIVYCENNSPNYNVRTAHLDFLNYQHSLQLNGGYFETNGTYSGTVLAQIYNGTTFLMSTKIAGTQYYEYNGTLVNPSVVWSVDNTLTRTYVLASGQTSVTLYVPNTNHASYTIYIYDFTGYVVTGTTTLDILFPVNGVPTIIERMVIPSSDQVTPVLSTGLTYTRQVILSIGTYQDTYSPSAVTFTDTMNIRLSSFSTNIQLAYQYLKMQSMRPVSTEINASYLDSLDKTTSLNVTIYTWNASSTTPLVKVYSTLVTPVTGGNAYVEWDSANASLSYKVVMTAIHQVFGTMYDTEYFYSNPTYRPPFSLSFFGNQPWLTDIIPYGLILATGAVFSSLTVVPGMMAIVVVSGLLYLLGWLPTTVETPIVIVISLVILFSLARRKETGYD